MAVLFGLFTIATAACVAAMCRIGGTIGAVIVAWSLDKLRPARVIGAACLAARSVRARARVAGPAAAAADAADAAAAERPCAIRVA